MSRIPSLIRASLDSRLRFGDETGVDKNKFVTVCEVKMSLRRTTATTHGEILANSVGYALRSKIVTGRGVAKTDVNCS